MVGVRKAKRASGTPLPRDAERLLSALGAAGAAALPDPLDPAALVVRKARAGVSLGGGRFPRAAGEALESAGLALRVGGVLRLAQAGLARLRRAAAAPEEAFLAQHLDLETGVAEGGERVRRDASESPLAWLRRRRDRDGAPLVGAAAFEAGERLRRDLTAAALLPRITVAWDAAAVDGGGPRDPAAASDAVIAARQRVTRALDAVGDDLSGLLVDLCGFLKGLESIERERGWPPRSGKVIANLALARLARHYGLADAARGPDRARSRLWRAEGES